MRIGEQGMRVFVGIDLPVDIRRTLLEFQSDLRHLGVSGSWKSLDNLHITLEFLGELEANVIPTLTETLTKIARNYEPFKLSIEELGGFPSIKRPHTLWTAVGGSINELHRLRDEIHTELAKNGFVVEDRQFNPHITLASRPKLNDTDLSIFFAKKIGEFIVAEIVLFESREIQGKRIYTDLHRASLEASVTY